MATDTPPRHTGLLVIGGGPGGYAAAFEAAKLGLEVTLVSDEKTLGGVCLQRGCIPSKTLLQMAELLQTARSSKATGVTYAEPKIDLAKVRSHKDAVINQLTSGIATLCKQRGVRVVNAHAAFENPKQVRLSGENDGIMAFDTAIIATGSRPTALPGTTFGERIMSSTEALELVDIPESLLVVGGGYIGLEMGMVYQALGTRVTLVEAADRLLPGADADLVKPLAKVVNDHFESVSLTTQASKLDASQNHVEVTLDTGKDTVNQRFDRVLVAIGRSPNTHDLNLPAADVHLDDRGFVEVDAARRTSARNIHAIGDVAGGLLLAHKAIHEGKVAARVAAGQDVIFDPRAIPAVVFTHPQVAWCGLVEADIADTSRNVKVMRFPWLASGRAVSMSATRGLTKILADADTGRILGVGIVGPQAEALIAEGVLAMEMGATAEDIALTIHPHPTLAETVGEGAELFFGAATHYG